MKQRAAGTGPSWPTPDGPVSVGTFCQLVRSDRLKLTPKSGPF